MDDLVPIALDLHAPALRLPERKRADGRRRRGTACLPVGRNRAPGASLISKRGRRPVAEPAEGLLAGLRLLAAACGARGLCLWGRSGDAWRLVGRRGRSGGRTTAARLLAALRVSRPVYLEATPDGGTAAASLLGADAALAATLPRCAARPSAIRRAIAT